MIRILNSEPLDYSQEARDILQSLGELEERYLTRSRLLACIANYEVLIVRLGFKVDRQVIDAGKNLKVIITATTGLDHIDVIYAEKRGIKVLSLRGHTEFLRTIPATAEHTWSLLLSLTRRIPWAFQSVLSENWNRDSFRGHDLAGRRLGIIGLGRIGERVAQYGLAFGMQVSAYDPYRSGWPPLIERHTVLSSLLSTVNVLSLHVPLNDQTHYMIGATELGYLPPGALLVNTSRGGVLDEVALVKSLRTRQLGGAALDVLNNENGQQTQVEPDVLEYARKNNNLLITPHIGGATFESMAATEIFMARKLREYLISKKGDELE
jgi:D-3-phosphoglycerate dehydrogenase